MAQDPVILLTSAWDAVNIGDMAHAPGTLRVMEQNLPHAKVILWVERIEADLEVMVRQRFPNVRVIEGTVSQAGEPGSAELAAALEEATIVVQNSSMSERAGVMRAARRWNKPFGLFAHSYFPRILDSPEVVDALHDAAFIYCRDTLTRDTLKQASLRAPVLEFNPDGCFGFDLTDSDGLAFLTRHGLEPGRFITVQLRTNTQKRPGTDNPLNPANPTPDHIAADERRAAVLRDMITGWVKQTGYKVLIAPEVKKEIEHNRRLLLEPLPASVRKHVVLRERFWSTAEAAAVFAAAHTVVCHEPHSCILGLVNGTPILHTYSPFHGPKYHMFADVGLPEWLLPLDECSGQDILDQLMSINQNYSVAQERVSEAMRFVHARHAVACRMIDQVMRQA